MQQHDYRDTGFGQWSEGPEREGTPSSAIPIWDPKKKRRPEQTWLKAVVIIGLALGACLFIAAYF
jgi:hypothetical protein